MSITSGFFNSQGGDRTYDAKQMGSLFGGIIRDGIFSNYPNEGDQMAVSKVSGMTIKVGPGRGWFHNTWIDNDADLQMTLTAASSLHPRIDSLFIKVDTSNAGRQNSIVLLEGLPADTPVAPTPTNTNPTEIFFYRLADIAVPANATEAGTITNYVGTEIPVVTGPLQVVTAQGVLDIWKREVDQTVQQELDAYLGDDGSALYQKITDRPNIWLHDTNIWPYAAGTLPGTTSMTLRSGFYPHNNENYYPKTGDVVIGKNGFYAVVTSSTWANDYCTAVVSPLGRRIGGNRVWLYNQALPSSSYSMIAVSEENNPGFYPVDVQQMASGDYVLCADGRVGRVSRFSDWSPTGTTSFRITLTATPDNLSYGSDFLVSYWNGIGSYAPICDRTYSDIAAAYAAGKNIRFRWYDAHGDQIPDFSLGGSASIIYGSDVVKNNNGSFNFHYYYQETNHSDLYETLLICHYADDTIVVDYEDQL